MNAKKKLILFASALCGLCLASCADTSELYEGDAYISQIFEENRYNTWAKGLKEASSASEKTLENEEHGYFNGSGEYDTPAQCSGFAQAAEWHRSAFLNSKGQLLQWSPDIINYGRGVWGDQSSLYDVAYGQTKKLTRIDSSFSRGYMSKLYNGQVRCNAWSSYSLVELDKTGYGTLFPKELASSDYFAMSIRGGSNTSDSGVGRVVTMDIKVSFYKVSGSSYASYSVNLDDVKLNCNYSAEATSLVGFYFSDVGLSPAGIIGMSVTYSLVNDPYQAPSTDDFEDGNAYHTGLILLEILFPDSTWN